MRQVTDPKVCQPAFLTAAVFLIVVGIASSPCIARETSKASPDAASLIGKMERVDHPFLFDMHGNANENLRKLELLRFRATNAIEDAIDRIGPDPRKANLVAALYRVLGFVKDPTSTPWLEKKLHSDPASIYSYYLPGWHDGIGYGFGNNEGFGGWRWMTGRAQWIAFFIQAHSNETLASRRILLMNILKGFDDPAVMEFFKTQRSVTQDPREVLLTEAYFRQHDVLVDEVRVANSVDALRGDSRNRPLLIGAADALRDVAFVSYLIDTLNVAEENVLPPQYLSLPVLQATTFELNIEDKLSWESWYAQHRAGDRAAWVQSAIISFRNLLQRDPKEAKEWFEKKASYRWNDLDALPLISDDLLPRKEFHSDIAGWINMTYTEFRRPRLKPIADMLNKHPELLEDWAKERLMERGFMPAKRTMTWETYVAYSNMRM